MKTEAERIEFTINKVLENLENLKETGTKTAEVIYMLNDWKYQGIEFISESDLELMENELMEQAVSENDNSQEAAEISDYLSSLVFSDIPEYQDYYSN